MQARKVFSISRATRYRFDVFREDPVELLSDAARQASLISASTARQWRALHRQKFRHGVVTLSFSGWKGQRLVDIQATQAAI
ncbi:hypothetical protein ACC684_27505, partial [Rhizobium ruizarguesonis]